MPVALAAVAAGRGARRHRRPGLEGLGPADRPAGQHARQHAGPADARPPRSALATGARRWTSSISPDFGAGAGAFVVARTRYRTDTLAVRHAHGYAVQTLADLGLVGSRSRCSRRWVAGRGAARHRACGARDRGLPFDPERIGLITMASVVVVFGVHSLIDWTWFVPGNAVVALLCAGWVAGRGPLRDRSRTSLAASPMRRFGSRRGASRIAVAAALGVLAVGLVAELGCAPAGARGSRGATAAIAALSLGDYDRCGARGAAPQPTQPALARSALALAFIADARGDKRARKRKRSSGRPAPARQRRGVAAPRPLPAHRARRTRGARLRRSGPLTSSTPRRCDSASDVLEASRALQARGLAKPRRSALKAAARPAGVGTSRARIAVGPNHRGRVAMRARRVAVAVSIASPAPHRLGALGSRSAMRAIRTKPRTPSPTRPPTRRGSGASRARRRRATRRSPPPR